MIVKRKTKPESPLAVYLKARVVIDHNGCWLWQGALQSQGYATAWYAGVTCRAHRLSYTEFVGPIPPGLLVLHTCDVRRCINPNHLFTGTYQTNSDDKLSKQRQARGEKQGLSRLTVSDVLQIRQDTRPAPAIARDFGVSKRTIHAIKNRETWTHVAADRSDR